MGQNLNAFTRQNEGRGKRRKKKREREKERKEKKRRKKRRKGYNNGSMKKAFVTLQTAY